MKKYQQVFFFSPLTSLVTDCNAQFVYDNHDGIKVTYSFQRTMRSGDTTLNLGLLITDSINQTTIDFGSISLNGDNVLDKDSLENILQSKYSELVNQYGKQTLINQEEYLQTLIETIADTISSRNAHSYVFQGLNIYNTIVKAAIRDNDGRPEFTIDDEYLKVMSSFVVEQDIYYNISDFKAYLNERSKKDTNVGIGYYLGALENESADSLNDLPVE